MNDLGLIPKRGKGCGKVVFVGRLWVGPQALLYPVQLLSVSERIVDDKESYCIR